MCLEFREWCDWLPTLDRNLELTMFFPRFKLASIALLLLAIPALTLAELKIENAWIKNLPPSVPVRAGYMTITNTGTQAVSIDAIECASCTSVELHETVMNDGMMSMQHVPTLKIEAAQSISLKPGGKHLMLHPLEPTQVGDKVTITLRLNDGSSQSVELIVRQ